MKRKRTLPGVDELRADVRLGERRELAARRALEVAELRDLEPARSGLPIT